MQVAMRIPGKFVHVGMRSTKICARRNVNIVEMPVRPVNACHSSKRTDTQRPLSDLVLAGH